MSLFDALLALMLVLLLMVAVGRWLLQLCDCLWSPVQQIAEEPLSAQLTLYVQLSSVPTEQTRSEQTPASGPYPPGRGIA